MKYVQPNHRASKYLCNSTAKCLPKGKFYGMPSQTLYKNISAVLVIKSQTRNSSGVHQQENGLINVAYLHNVILPYNKKELLMPAKTWMNPADIRSKNLGTMKYTLYGFIYVNFQNRLTCGEKTRTSVPCV